MINPNKDVANPLDRPVCPHKGRILVTKKKKVKYMTSPSHQYHFGVLLEFYKAEGIFEQEKYSHGTMEWK